MCRHALFRTNPQRTEGPTANDTGYLDNHDTACIAPVKPTPRPTSPRSTRAPTASHSAEHDDQNAGPTASTPTCGPAAAQSGAISPTTPAIAASTPSANPPERNRDRLMPTPPPHRAHHLAFVRTGFDERAVRVRSRNATRADRDDPKPPRTPGSCDRQVAEQERARESMAAAQLLFVRAPGQPISSSITAPRRR